MKTTTRPSVAFDVFKSEGRGKRHFSQTTYSAEQRPSRVDRGNDLHFDRSYQHPFLAIFESHTEVAVRVRVSYGYG